MFDLSPKATHSKSIFTMFSGDLFFTLLTLVETGCQQRASLPTGLITSSACTQAHRKVCHKLNKLNRR